MAAIGDIKEAIIALYNEATRGNIADDSEDLDIAIQLCLDDLSKDLDALKVTDTDTVLESGTNFIDLPTDYKMLISIVLFDSNGARQDPLMILPGGQIQYEDLLEDSSAVSTPRMFWEDNDGFWLWQPSNGDYTSEIQYYRYHPTGQLDDILFPKFMTNAVKYGTVFFRQLLKGNPKYITIWGPTYEAEKEKCRLLLPQEPYITEG